MSAVLAIASIGFPRRSGERPKARCVGITFSVSLLVSRVGRVAKKSSCELLARLSRDKSGDLAGMPRHQVMARLKRDTETKAGKANFRRIYSTGSHQTSFRRPCSVDFRYQDELYWIYIILQLVLALSKLFGMEIISTRLCRFPSTRLPFHEAAL